ncbi:hypothetical protein ACQ86B_00340 [Mycolicibacterium aichiense]|uniref:hypothetical protein n=1 Tax=Mycolicibacterium aichiense TaxID=1799 RepID=UPI003D6738BF
MSRFTDHCDGRGCGGLVGRVGALALFLGIGMALSPGLASADPNTADHASSRAHSGTAKAPSAAKPSAKSSISSAARDVRASMNSARPVGARSPRPTKAVAARRPGQAPARLPAPDDALAAAAQWIRRQVGVTFFNASPTIGYDSAQNGTSPTASSPATSMPPIAKATGSPMC